MVNLSAPQLDRIFHALADATRRQMLAELARGDATVSALGRPHEMSLVAASKHVRVLEDAGLIRSHKEGRTRTCSINRAAFETAQEIAQWFFVDANWRAEAENELKVGGSYRLTMHTDAGETHVMHGEYLELERPRRLSFTWSSHVAKDTTVLVELEPTAGGTRLKLTHTLPSDEDIVRAHAMGWEGCLESLGRLLAGNAGP